MLEAKSVELRCERTILHFDYDCFYAAVFEAEDPKLKYLPLAVQQKHIIVTCNYEARRRGLYKLQLITDARRICPEVIIVLGEDLTKFRDVSKDLARFLANHVWSGKCERLGFDETWLDVSSTIEHNLDLIKGDIKKSFFQLSRDDPTVGFDFDASVMPGYVYPEKKRTMEHQSTFQCSPDDTSPLEMRLRLGSHLAAYLRARLEEKGFTATVGISVNKLLSKLIGNVHKPDAQTTLMPPYNFEYGEDDSSVSKFLDALEIGKIPGIGFKISQRLREVILGRESAFHGGFGPDNNSDAILVRDVRLHPEMSARNLQKKLGGTGWPKDIGLKVYQLINGVDDSEVATVKLVPTQISIEDTYLVLNNMQDLRVELVKLSVSLLKRMRLDLVDDTQPNGDQDRTQPKSFAWLAVPKTLRLSTRPRPPRDADGNRQRTFHRISRSGPFPSFLLATLPMEDIAIRFVDEVLLKMFKRLHTETEWDISLLNIAVTNMSTMAGDGKNTAGRDISKMLLSATSKISPTVQDKLITLPPILRSFGSEDEPTSSQSGAVSGNSESWNDEDTWNTEAGDEEDTEHCKLCSAIMPSFALEAHLRFHLLPD